MHHDLPKNMKNMFKNDNWNNSIVRVHFIASGPYMGKITNRSQILTDINHKVFQIVL